MEKTRSEQLFELFCQSENIRYDRIQRRDKEGVQTPDYNIFTQMGKVVVEVKQFDPNKEDKKILQQLKQRGFGDSSGVEPGQRVRSKIKPALSQLKKRSKGQYPAVLVLYNNIPFTSRHINPYDIKIGMYGLEVIDLEIFSDLSYKTKLKDKRFGPKRKMTPTDNTTLSAIAALYGYDENNLTLIFFHNRYAKIRLPTDWIKSPRIRHFTLGEKKNGEFQEWIEISDS